MSRGLKKSRGVKPAATEFHDEEKISQNSFPVVGIGASAGGLEAFTKLLSHLPENTGMAFVLVQHLDPDHPSQLTNLLSKATKLSVQEVKSGVRVEADHIYVIPPNTNLELSAGKLQLTPRGKSRIPHPVDYFFSSLAREQQSLAVGIVLSGTGSDGALGLKAIKEVGGITFAQDEKSAKFSGMPMQAAGGAADFILPPEKIALELGRIGRNPFLARPKTESEEDEAAQTKDFRRILGLLRAHTGVDLHQYRDTTIKRRIQRRMIVRTRHTLPDYIKLLEKEPAEINALFDDVLINVTSFFRDPEMFETLKKSIFPKILKTSPKVIRVWVVACSTGQEAYSLAMALLEFLEQKSNPPAIQIFATDISETVSIEKGRRGFYPESIESEVSPARLRRFFTKEDGGYRISKAVRELCVFAKQNAISDPPFSRMDLVSCRNFLIYLTPVLQRHVISTFHYALNPHGYLVLGNSETVGANSDLFGLLDRKYKLFAKKGAAIRPFSHFAAQDLKSRSTATGYAAPLQAATPSDFQKEADRVLLGRFAPAGVLVNSSLEVLQFRGRTSPYLEPPTGEASFNLLKMARGNLSLELGTAIREAKKKNISVRRNVRLDDDDTLRKVNLEILPLKLAGSLENCFLVLFNEAGKSVAPPAKNKTADRIISPTEKRDELNRLRTELASAREYVQAITEQHEAASEGLKCANEEVLSSNEELQSLNEQLGTAKEELQSTNEELQTLNEELQTRNVELNQLNNDLGNLLTNLKIPILMLGKDLRIRRFNPPAAEFFHFKPQMLGRSLHSIDSPLITTSLENSLLEVIAKVKPIEIEVHDNADRWFLLRLYPYRMTDGSVDGVILTLLDVDDLKRTQEKFVEFLNYVNAIVDTIRGPLLVLHADLRVRTANDSFCETFRVSKQETENRLIYELGNGQWNIAELRRLLAELLTNKTLIKDYEVTHTFPVVGHRQMRLNARRLEQKQLEVPPMILVSIEDITEWRRAEKELIESVEREQKANLAKDDFLAKLSHELRTPLNPILLIASDAAEDHNLPPEVRTNFDIIRKSVEIEARLIDDLLDLTRIATGKFSFEKTCVDAHAIIQDVIASSQVELAEKKVELNLLLKSKRHHVRGDAVRLQQVFWNVLKNAVKFTPGGGRITIETFTSKNSDHLTVTIADTGIGMTADELKRIFVAFSQGDHANQKHLFGGLGLGLAISSQILELHAGHIHAASKGRDQGSTFTIELPLDEPNGINFPRSKYATDHISNVRQTKSDGLRILLVEDHEPTRSALTQLLTRRNYIILAASSIAEARAIASEGKIDLVISDIGLPDGDGNALMIELTKEYPLKGIALTGYGMEQDHAKSLASGFLTHLTKPIRVHDLENALHLCIKEIGQTALLSSVKRP